MKDSCVMKYNRQTPCVYKKINVVYHGVPKNASTSVKNALYEYEHGHPFDGNKQWIHKGNEKGGSIYPSLDSIRSDFEDALHFTVVRHPFERFKSFYSDIFARTTNIRVGAPPFYTDNQIKIEEKPIDEVIDMIEQFSDDEADEHFASQSSFVHHDNCCIVKMEDMEAGWIDICERLSVEHRPLSVYNKSEDIVMLNDNQKQRLYQRYSDDFNNFDYKV